MADEELKELLDQLETNAAENDATVERARDSLESTLASLKLTPEEEAVLAGELAQLRELGQKLDDNTIEIAAFGMVSRGKMRGVNLTPINMKLRKSPIIRSKDLIVRMTLQSLTGR